MSRKQRVMAGRCRVCGAKGHTPHKDDCIWIGGVCEYQLQPTPTVTEGQQERLKGC